MVAAFAFPLGACDLLLGLNQYQNVACAFDCDAGSEATTDTSMPGPDASDARSEQAAMPDAMPDADASVDAPLDSTVEAEAAPPPEGGYPVPAPSQVWVHWPMPNPDASIDPTNPDAAALPHAMAYDAGADGGASVAYDLTTNLVWWRASLQAMSFDDAWGACAARQVAQPSAYGWRVPTRIELLSLVDFTRMPTIDPGTFPGTGGAYWTSSPNANINGGYWTVSFLTGLVAGSSTTDPVLVLCVTGPVPDGGSL